jgi:hypothetical protein
LGRFVSADSLVPRPDDPQSFNRFAYARDNPINRTDPTGFSDVLMDPDLITAGSPHPKEDYGDSQEDGAKAVNKVGRQNVFMVHSSLPGADNSFPLDANIDMEFPDLDHIALSTNMEVAQKISDWMLSK